MKYKVQLEYEENYLENKTGVVKELIQLNIDKVMDFGSTDYSRFIGNIFKSQSRWIDQNFVSQSDFKIVNNLVDNVEVLYTLEDLHKGNSKQDLKNLISNFKSKVRENMTRMDLDMDADERVSDIINWFDDNLKHGYDTKVIRERLSTECLKYDDEPANEIKKKLLKST